jgi:hypothetical protein
MRIHYHVQRADIPSKAFFIQKILACPEHSNKIMYVCVQYKREISTCAGLKETAHQESKHAFILGSSVYIDANSHSVN